MTDKAKTRAQLLAELTALQQRVIELETEQQQRDAELEHWLAAERESWALAEALNQTGAAIGSSLRGEEVLDRILEEMSRVVACDAACLFLIEGDLARVYRWRGYVHSGRATPTEIVSAALRIDHIPVLRTVRKTSRPLAVPHPTNNEEWVHKFGTLWVKSYACAPIRSRGRVIGFLTVDSETPGFFEPADTEPLQAFADQAAMALENVGLHDRMRGEIVERLKTLKKERNFISTLLDTANALVMALNREGRIVHFNRACEQTSGYTFAEVKNRYLWDLLPPETATPAPIYFTELPPDHSSTNSSQLPAKFESFLVTKTGQPRLIAWSNATLFDKTGAVEYFIATGIDITEQRRAKTALQENEALLRATFEQVAVGITCATMDGKFFQANDRFCHMLGYSRDEILTMTVADVTHPDDLAVDLAYMQEMNEGKRNSFALEKRYVRKDGVFVWVNLSVSLVHLPASGLKYAVGVVEDITERKRMEEERRRNYSFLQTLMDNLSVCIFVKLAEDGRFVLWNKAIEQLTGFTAEAVLGHTDYDFFPKEQADFFRQKDREVFEKRMTVDIPEEPLDSQSLGRRILHTVKTPIYDESNMPLYLLGISEDITERVQAEAALRQSEQRLELALMGADLGLWDLNVQTGVDIVDQRAAKMLDFTLDEIEPHVKWWDNRTHPDDLPGVTEIFEAHLRGETSFYECEYRLLTKSGEWKWILDRGKIVQRDEQGHPIRLTGTHLDITERKQAEEALRIQNEQLQARNQELAAFARTVAHDLKNPLGALTGIAEILLEDYSHMPPEQLGEYLQSIVQGGRRASRIVEALLLLAGVRQRTVSLQPLDMASIVAESLQRLAEMIEQHQAEIIMPANWPTVLGYAPWIEEVWVNYLSNGLKYGGRPPRLELGATVQRNGIARFWVQDNGLGLTPEAQAQLFTEFTQLESNRVDGYGLGLSIVRRIVEKLGGQVEVESKPGRGSLFSFTLPLVNLPPTSNDQ